MNLRKARVMAPNLEVWIPAEHVTATNPQVRGRQLHVTYIYTDDSDLVAVLMHISYCRHTAIPPPPTVQEELPTIIRVLPPQDSYTSKLRNNVWSQPWGAAELDAVTGKMVELLNWNPLLLWSQQLHQWLCNKILLNKYQYYTTSAMNLG